MKNIEAEYSIHFLRNDYRILEKIGEGGCGCIFKAEQLSTGRTVAIKISKKDDDPILRRRLLKQFEQEVELCAQINHPNIIQFIDQGFLSDNRPYLVFEHIEGETLKKYILRNSFLSSKDMSNLMRQVLQAMVYAHKKGVVHGDLKPNNIMISQCGDQKCIKVLDFGVGCFIGDDQPMNEAKDNYSPSFVSPKYNAPEQLKGSLPTCKSDLYSWGLIVLECITGQAVMGGESARDVYEKQLSPKEVTLPLSIKNHGLGFLLQKVLKKDSSKRCCDANQVLQEFSKLDFSTIPNHPKPDRLTPPQKDDHTIPSAFNQ